MSRHLIGGCAVVLAAMVLAGCNSMPRRDPSFAPTYPAVPPAAPQAATGAIYHAGYDVALFEDPRARRVGDVLTIRLVESTIAKKSVRNTSDRSQTTTIANPTVLGTSPQFGLPGALPLASTKNNTLETKLSSSHEFDGGGDSEQSNSLKGDVTVTVAEVLPNGNLLVRGEKRLSMGDGNEYVKIAGIVRPVDIAADNSVESTRVADATIVYSGDGAAVDASKMAWLARFFISAIFPL